MSLDGRVVSRAVTFEYRATQQQLERMAAEMLLDAVDQPLAECQLDSDDGLVNRQQQQQQQQLEEEEQQQDKESEDQSLELTLLRKMCLLGDAEDSSNTEEPGKVRECTVDGIFLYCTSTMLKIRA